MRYTASSSPPPPLPPFPSEPKLPLPKLPKPPPAALLPKPLPAAVLPKPLPANTPLSTSKTAAEPIYDEPPLVSTKSSMPQTSIALAEPIYDEPPAEILAKHSVPSVLRPSRKEPIYDEPELVSPKSKAPRPVQYRARFSFTAGADGELSFCKGDILHSSSDVRGGQEEGWIMMRGAENQGWVPADYLEPVVSSSEGECGWFHIGWLTALFLQTPSPGNWPLYCSPGKVSKRN